MGLSHQGYFQPYLQSQFLNSQGNHVSTGEKNEWKKDRYSLTMLGNVSFSKL